jgi:hypothetical protein
MRFSSAAPGNSTRKFLSIIAEKSNCVLTLQVADPKERTSRSYRPTQLRRGDLSAFAAHAGNPTRPTTKRAANMKESTTFDPFQIMTRAFPPSPGLAAAAKQNASTFWDSQDKLLDSMEELMNGWFERRHVGAQEALATARQMCEAESPFDAMRECQKWAIGSFERVMQDGFAAQKHLLEFSRVTTQPFAQAAETARSEAGEAAHKAQSRARAA